MAVTESTCVYLLRNGEWLMLLRNRKDHDINKGKWIGIGGKREGEETFAHCAVREVYEETGLSVSSLVYAGDVYFLYDGSGDEYIRIYTSTDFTGTMHDCNEGTLAWINKENIMSLNLWEGDRVFLQKMMDNDLPFSITLSYDHDGNLVSVKEGIKR